MYVLQIVVCPLFYFLLTILLSVLSDIRIPITPFFGNFKLFLCVTMWAALLNERQILILNFMHNIMSPLVQKRIVLIKLDINVVFFLLLIYSDMDLNCLPFRSTRVHLRSLLGFVLLYLQLSVQCFADRRTLRCLYLFILGILIIPLISSNFS